jgi:hypothetical protein
MVILTSNDDEAAQLSDCQRQKTDRSSVSAACSRRGYRQEVVIRIRASAHPRIQPI